GSAHRYPVTTLALASQRGAWRCMTSGYGTALSNKRLYEVQNLRDQLEEADLRVQQAVIREQVLTEGLQIREHRIAQLETKQIELTARWENEVRERENTVADLTLAQKADAEELARLKVEVEQLHVELERARDASRQAEDRCRILEERLAEVEDKAQAGQEAREANELEEAQRAAAEAKAVADELRQQLEDLKEARESTLEELEAVRKSAVEATRQKFERAREEAAKERERSDISLANRSAMEISRDFLRLSAKGDESALYDLSRAVAKLTPIESVRGVCLNLWEKGYEVAAEELAGRVGKERSIQSLQIFLSSLVQQDSSRVASNLAEISLAQFAWFRDSTEVSLLMSILKKSGLPSWALHIQMECAARRSPGKLAELLRDMDPVEVPIMIEVISQSRATADIPPLLFCMEDLGLDLYIKSLLSRISQLGRHDSAMILEAWELAKD
ncbi:hypothetical protein ABT186_17900, partial [Streptomyces sp. NPDC001634]